MCRKDLGAWLESKAAAVGERQDSTGREATTSSSGTPSSTTSDGTTTDDE